MREDERETLAHIVQNIDEQEIFLEFIAKAETIKESWQIAKIFEDKKSEFMQSIGEYDSIIRDKEKELKEITNEIKNANNLLKDTNAKLESMQLKLDEMRSKAQFYKTKISQAELFLDDDVREGSLDSNDDSNILEFDSILRDFEPLTSVSVHIKNGATAMARAAQIIYEEALYEVYKRAAKRLYKLKDRINELELANKKLSIELRDLSEEDNFRENMRLSLDSNALSSESNLDLDILDSNINEKKERVEEMFQQLNDFLNEENKSEANINDIRHAIQDTIKNINKTS